MNLQSNSSEREKYTSFFSKGKGKKREKGDLGIDEVQSFIYFLVFKTFVLVSVGRKKMQNVIHKWGTDFTQNSGIKPKGEIRKLIQLFYHIS